MATGRPHVLALDAAPAMHGVRPAADPLFESAATGYGPNMTGVVISEWGRSQRFCRHNEAGGRTIVQDEATWVVWGMAGTAVRLGAAQTIAPVDAIAGEIPRTMRRKG